MHAQLGHERAGWVSPRRGGGEGGEGAAVPERGGALSPCSPGMLFVHMLLFGACGVHARRHAVPTWGRTTHSLRTAPQTVRGCQPLERPPQQRGAPRLDGGCHSGRRSLHHEARKCNAGTVPPSAPILSRACHPQPIRGAPWQWPRCCAARRGAAPPPRARPAGPGWRRAAAAPGSAPHPGGRAGGGGQKGGGACGGGQGEDAKGPRNAEQGRWELVASFAQPAAERCVGDRVGGQGGNQRAQRMQGREARGGGTTGGGGVGGEEGGAVDRQQAVLVSQLQLLLPPQPVRAYQLAAGGPCRCRGTGVVLAYARAHIMTYTHPPACTLQCAAVPPAARWRCWGWPWPPPKPACVPWSTARHGRRVDGWVGGGWVRGSCTACNVYASCGMWPGLCTCRMGWAAVRDNPLRPFAPPPGHAFLHTGTGRQARSPLAGLCAWHSVKPAAGLLLRTFTTALSQPRTPMWRPVSPAAQRGAVQEQAGTRSQGRSAAGRAGAAESGLATRFAADIMMGMTY